MTKKKSTKTTEEKVNKEKVAKKILRGYRVYNPKHPKAVYSQRLLAKLADGRSAAFIFFENENRGEGAPRGCIMTEKQKDYIEYFKAKGFKSEEIYR